MLDDFELRLEGLGNSILLEEAFIEQTLSLFFKWQYSQFMFVYREAFLLDHLQHAYGGKYWSPPLLYTMCALGATMSSDLIIQKSGANLALQSQEMLFGYGLEQPHITFVQALLCLAFYHIGQGNYSKGWSLSGQSSRTLRRVRFVNSPIPLRNGFSYGARSRILRRSNALGNNGWSACNATRS